MAGPIHMSSIVSSPLRFHPSSETEGWSVGPRKKARQKFSSTGGKAPWYQRPTDLSKRSSECWLLIGHKKCFVLLCPIGEQHLLSSFREFVHDGYCSLCTDVPPPSAKIGGGDVCESPTIIVFPFPRNVGTASDWL